MRQKVRQVLTHPLFSGSAIMIIGTNGIAGLNYIYHFAMGRLLGASAYGELVSLFSLIGLLGMVPTALNLVVIKFVSSSKSKAEVYSLISYLQKRVLIATLIIIAVSFLLAKPAKDFFKLSSEINFIFVGLVFAFSLFVFINRAVMQGALRFWAFVLNTLIDNVFKLVGGVFFVFLGYSVFGAMIALVIGSIFSIGLSFYLIRDYLKGYTRTALPIKPFVIYSLPVFAHQLSIVSFISSDLLLVKHYFDPVLAGHFSATSTIAKIIFFAASPIMAVMFPLISKRVANGEKYMKIFLYSVLLTLFVTVSGAIFFSFFAPLAVWILFGRDFGEASSYLPLFSLFMILLSLNNLLVGFYLSLNKTRIVIFPLIAAALQIILIIFYHDSLLTVLFISNITSALLSVILIVYSIYGREVNFSNSSSLQTTKDNSKRPRKNS